MKKNILTTTCLILSILCSGSIPFLNAIDPTAKSELTTTYELRKELLQVLINIYLF